MIELTEQERADLIVALDNAWMAKLDGMDREIRLYTEADTVEAKRQLDSWQVIKAKVRQDS